MAKQYLSIEQERELILKAQAGDKNSLEMLINNYNHLISMLARKYAGINMQANIQDLIQVGKLSLIETIQTFDLSKNCRLITYAFIYIKTSILTEVIENTGPIKETRRFAALYSKYLKLEQLYNAKGITLTNKLASLELDVPITTIEFIKNLENPILSLSDKIVIDDETMKLIDIITDSDNLEEDDILDKIDVYYRMQKIDLDILTDKQRQVVSLYFGLNNNQPKNCSEIAKMYGCTNQNIHLTLSNALKKLRKNYDNQKKGMSRN